MRPHLRAVAAQQGGLITRRQAVSAGCSERELKTLTGARGAWATVRRGVYVERVLWDGLGEDDRYRARVRAAVLAASKPAVVSHSSAAALHGLPIRPRWRELVHVTRPGVTGSRTEAGVKHHLAPYAARDVTTVSALPVMAPARTAVEIAREFGFEDGVVACDAALNQGATRSDLDRVLAGMRYWPGVTQARAAVEACDAGGQSIGETLARLLVVELGLGVPETQFEVVDGGRRAFVDLRIRRHLIEFDGKVKYLGRESGGVAGRSPEEVVWEEKRREDWLRGHDGGYGMSRLVWADLFGSGRVAAKRRLAEDIARSDRLFGHLEG